MNIRSITKPEIEGYAALGDDPSPESVRSLVKLSRDMWDQGSSRPEWFFIAEENGIPIARAAYWRLAVRPEELRLIAFKLPWEGDYLGVGLTLLLESWEKLRRHGVRFVLRQLYAHWDYLDEQREVMEHAGMRLLQKKLTYQWNPGEHVSVPARLTFESVESVGEPDFLEAIRLVTAESPDREIVALGVKNAAETLFGILKEDTVYRPGWAQLAYDPEGSLVGLVAPVGMPDAEDEGSIGYIGVVPEQRGKGYAHDLLARGMTVLQSAGFTTVYSETDAQNQAMIRAFERAGHRPGGRLWLYRARL